MSNPAAKSPDSGPLISPEGEEKNRAAHDPSTPQALLDFMLQGWRPRSEEAADPIPGIERFAQRRQALSRRFPNNTLLIPTGHEKVRANDTYYRFRPSSDFYYLTG